MALVKPVVEMIHLLLSKCVWVWLQMKSSSVHVMSKLKCKLLCQECIDIHIYIYIGYGYCGECVC
jgi:hypothetical protein